MHIRNKVKKVRESFALKNSYKTKNNARHVFETDDLALRNIMNDDDFEEAICLSN